MDLKYIVQSQDQPDLMKMGGKAFALARLGNNFQIPDWFVVTPGSFTNTGFKDGFAQELLQVLDKLGNGPFAVRSSALEEDSADNSFAGQLESYLNVAKNAVDEAILQVVASANGQRLREYRKNRNLQDKHKRPAVIVQKMVPAEFAGVAFSVDPVTYNQEHAVIVVTMGLADKLVSGEINGETYHLDKRDRIIKQDLLSDKGLLSLARLKKIAQLCRAAEKHFGAPQDIEWAMADDRLFLLQARPITTLNFKENFFIWDNANIVESYSGVTSPLTFSFAQYVYAAVYKNFAKIMGVSARIISKHNQVFDNLLGYLNGRIYYNLLNWYRALALLPGFRINYHFMEQMMGVKESLPPEILLGIREREISLYDKLRDACRFLKAIAQILYNNMAISYKIRRFYNSINEALATADDELTNMTAMELLQHYKLLEQKLLNRWQAPLINDFMCMIAFGLSRSVLKKWCKEGKGLSLHNDLMIGQGDIVSAEPARRIKQMARLIRGNPQGIKLLIKGDARALKDSKALATAFQDYLNKFGDRCTQELKLESLTLLDDPRSLLQAIGFLASREDQEEQNQQITDISQALKKAMPSRPWRRAMVRTLVNWAKRRVSDRENLRFERTRVFGRIRKVFVNIGQHFCDHGLINERRDIFFLSVPEIFGVINGTGITYDLKSLVALRKRDKKHFNKINHMPDRVETQGDFLVNISAFADSKPSVKDFAADIGQGLGCCRGKITARVRLITDPRKQSIKPGEILVAKHTDPGWIALFSNAAGIIVERGSLLSHSAIVAREMGIPAIVAVPDLLNWLKTGDVVEMNGQDGQIRRLKRA